MRTVLRRSASLILEVGYKECYSDADLEIYWLKRQQSSLDHRTLIIKDGIALAYRKFTFKSK